VPGQGREHTHPLLCPTANGCYQDCSAGCQLRARNKQTLLQPWQLPAQQQQLGHRGPTVLVCIRCWPYLQACVVGTARPALVRPGCQLDALTHALAMLECKATLAAASCKAVQRGVWSGGLLGSWAAAWSARKLHCAAKVSGDQSCLLEQIQFGGKRLETAVGDSVPAIHVQQCSLGQCVPWRTAGSLQIVDDWKECRPNLHRSSQIEEAATVLLPLTVQVADDHLGSWAQGCMDKQETVAAARFCQCGSLAND